MNTKDNQLKITYQENGYLVLRGFFEKNETLALRETILKFHDSWKQENAVFYKQKAVNSAYITAPKYLDKDSRVELFRFIGSDKIMDIAGLVLRDRPTFMNTQLFFNPADEKQKNYWHRDPQYHLSLAEQEKALVGPDVVHFRIPLCDEPGIELVPGSHKRWDSKEELDVRLEKNGRSKHHDLSSGTIIKLQEGDLLIFSANMIHRGLYGQNRLAFDILLCEPVPTLVKHVQTDCLPELSIREDLENPDAFDSTIELMNLNSIVR